MKLAASRISALLILVRCYLLHTFPLQTAASLRVIEDLVVACSPKDSGRLKADTLSYRSPLLPLRNRLKMVQFDAVVQEIAGNQLLIFYM